MKSVYLAGPIAGLSYETATDWREHAETHLLQHGIRSLSPLRAKSYLAGLGTLNAKCDGYAALSPLSGPRGVMARDRFDATRCDVLLVNLLGATKVSMGTVMEIAWADLKRTPVVCVMEPGNIHEHAMVNEAIDFRCSTLEAALNLVVAIL